MEPLEKNFVRFVVLFSLFRSVFNFNFDTNFTIVYDNPGLNGTLFGYSVILYEGNKNIGAWVQVGAPKDITGSKNLETGNVYRCGIAGQCYPLSMPIEVKINGACLGNSMDLSPDGEVFAACGHRWVEVGNKDYFAKGFCHWGRTHENVTEQKIPFEGQSLTIERRKTKIFNFGQGQAGFSAQFSNTRETSEVIVGAPGVYNWAGLAFLWKRDDDSGITAARRFRRATESLSTFLIPPGDAASVADLSLFGYSVTSGKFFDMKDLYYVAGAPRVDMIGEIMIFTFDNNRITEKQRLRGKVYGEYYGGSLASANLNGDNFADLIVGAPTYSSKDDSRGSNKYDEGRIYIYYGSPNRLGDDDVTTIEGKQAGGQFGEAVMALGDIDFDGYDDIAVAATYEDGGAGAVYIYRGSQDGINKIVAQVIRGKSFEPHAQIRGFGHSMSRPRDIDGNLYSDVAIGAYKSEHVLIFRARPVIVLHHELENSNLIVDIMDKHFTFTSCVYYTTKKEFSHPGIVLTPEFVIDQRYRRAFISDTIKDIVLNIPGRKVCETYNVELKKTIDNRFEAIQYTLNLKLKENPVVPNLIRVQRYGVTGHDNFCSSCPVLDPNEPKEWEGRLAGFNLGCGDTNVCNAKLHLAPSFKGVNNNVFVIGSEQFLKLTTEVENTGDRAFFAELSIALPSYPKVSLRSVPPNCRENNVAFITCSVADPLEQNAKKTIELELDMDKINSGTNAELAFNVSISTSSINQGSSSKVLVLYAKKMASIKITGRSKEKYYQFDNTSSVVEFAQVLQIQREGPSAIDDVGIILDVPLSIRNVQFLGMYPPTLAPKGQAINCRGINFIEKTVLLSSDADDSVDVEVDRTRRKRSAEDVTEKFQHFTGFYFNCTHISEFKCERLYCNTGLVNKDVVEILFKFRMNITNIPKDILGESDVLVIASTFNATIEDNALRSSPGSELVLPSVLVGPNVQKKVPIWIIIVAVLCGIIVLAVIAAVLYKFGFFKRAQKEKLEEMKAEVCT